MKIIRAVVDTNIFVSGMISKHGIPHQIQNEWVSEKFQLVASKSIIREVFRVFHYPKIKEIYRLRESEIRRLVRLIFRKAIITDDLHLVEAIPKDTSDNKFVACAVEGAADYLISGDEHLLELQEYEDTKIVRAKDFVRVLRTGKRQKHTEPETPSS